MKKWLPEGLVIALIYAWAQNPRPTLEAWAYFFFVGVVTVAWWAFVIVVVVRSARALKRGLRGEPIRGGKT